MVNLSLRTLMGVTTHSWLNRASGCCSQLVMRYTRVPAVRLSWPGMPKSSKSISLGIIVTYLKHASTEVLLTEQASRTPLNIQMNQDEHRSRCKSRATHSDGNVTYKMNERVGTRRCHCALDKHGKQRKNRKGTKVANRSRNREVTSSTRDDVMCGGEL